MIIHGESGMRQMGWGVSTSGAWYYLYIFDVPGGRSFTLTETEAQQLQKYRNRKVDMALFTMLHVTLDLGPVAALVGSLR